MRFFLFPVAVLPGVDYLGGFAQPRANTPFRILQGNPGDGCVEQEVHKCERVPLLHLALTPPAGATVAEIRAGRMKNSDVPTVIDHGQDIALKVV